MDFEMEDLIPIVKRLSEKYTSKESSSITYDKAMQLMEAVLYCIHEEQTEFTITSGKEDAKRVYQAGYENVLIKLQNTQKQYNEMMDFFNAWENDNYRLTVTKAIPGFFRYYDPMFFPQNSVITMDYPILESMMGLTGVDAVQKYINAIYLEQTFFSKLSDGFMKSVLSSYQADYQKLFINICRIPLRSIIGCMMIQKKIGELSIPNHYEQLKEMILSMTKEQLNQKLISLLRVLVDCQYDGDEQLYRYLENDMADFGVELQNGAVHNCLEQIVVL